MAEVTFTLPELENKEIIYIGDDKSARTLEDFLNKYAAVRSFKIINENESDKIKALQQGDFTSTTIIKTASYPGRFVPAPYTTKAKIFFECVKQLNAKTVGVTGTKGKTTTSSLLAHILRNAGISTALADDSGHNLLQTLENSSTQTVFVLELSSFQLADLEISPDLAIITNLYRDHIDYHGKLESYWEAKRNIMRYMDTNGGVIYNPLTDMVSHWLAESEAHQLPINPNEAVDMSKSQLIGDHNRLNYLLARKAAETLGVDIFTIQSALSTFKPVKYRLQKVRTVKGITFIDDSIASDPDSAVADITACIREVGPVGCVILGGKDGDYDFTALAKILSTLMIPKLILFPDTDKKIKDLLPDSYQPEMLGATDMDVAVKWAADKCPSGSVCLLTSGSPTGSLWKDFEDKGNQFQSAVMDLSN